MHTHHLCFYFTTYSLGTSHTKLLVLILYQHSEHHILLSDKCKTFLEQAKEEKYF